MTTRLEHPIYGAGACEGSGESKSVEEIPKTNENENKNAFLATILMNFIKCGVLDGITISGGAALFLLSHYIEGAVKSFNIFNGDLQKDIDFVLSNRDCRSNGFIRLKENLCRFGTLTQVKSERTAARYGSVARISDVLTMNWLVDLEKSDDPMIALMKMANGGELPENMKTKFSVNIDFVFCKCSSDELIKEQWVLHEYRTYALKIDRGDFTPIKIAQIGFKNAYGRVRNPRDLKLNYIKNMHWKYNNEGLPGNHSGQILPTPEYVEVDPLIKKGSFKIFERIQKLMKHEVSPYEFHDIFRSLSYTPSISPKDIQDTFSDLDEKSAIRVHEHIHAKDSVCILCQDVFSNEGFEFIVLPCGCTSSVYHIPCFVKNLLKLNEFGKLSTECYSCKKVFQKHILD